MSMSQEDRFKDMAVVVLETAVEEAYRMGYMRFNSADEIDSDEDIHMALDGFIQSAEWANTVLPSLRATAGYADGGRGTYQLARDVALIRHYEMDDRPIEAEQLNSSYLYDDLVDAFQYGAIDAMEGNEPSMEPWLEV